jgi:hypothetical protein
MLTRRCRYEWSFFCQATFLDLPFSAASSPKADNTLLDKRSEHADRISSSLLHTLTVLLPFLPYLPFPDIRTWKGTIAHCRLCALCWRGGPLIPGYALETLLSAVFVSFGLSRSFGVKLVSFSTAFRVANGPTSCYHRFVYIPVCSEPN